MSHDSSRHDGCTVSGLPNALGTDPPRSGMLRFSEQMFRCRKTRVTAATHITDLQANGNISLRGVLVRPVASGHAARSRVGRKA